jgi:hypothetical protein
MLNVAGSREGPYEMLEPDAGKLASPVLRGAVVTSPCYPARLKVSNFSAVYNMRL